jgi:hypothetical protein
MAFATMAGVALLAWWAAAALDLLPGPMAPRQQAVSHVVAEVSLGAALLAGGFLESVGPAVGRPLLAGALGALAYAGINTMSDFADVPFMQIVLATTALAAGLALLSLLSDAHGNA